MTPTPVIFRTFPGGEVIALFPTEPGTNDPSTCMGYMHTGQHGDADVSLVADTRPATVNQRRALRRELEAIGYRVKLRRRFHATDWQARAEALAVCHNEG